MLTVENIVLGQAKESKEEAIKRCGAMLVQAGVVEEAYVPSMLARDAGFSVAIGNLIAIPHAEKAAACHIKKTGLCVITYPEGIQWDDELVKLVVGIAAIGDEHLEILQNIVEKLEEESQVEELVATADKQTILELFTG